MQCAHQSATVVPPRNITGQSEAISSNICRCNVHIPGQSPRNSGPKWSYWQQWQQLMQWAHPNVLAASSLNYGSRLTQSIHPYFLLMGPSGLSQNHGSNCTWVLLTTTTCSVSWAPFNAIRKGDLKIDIPNGNKLVPIILKDVFYLPEINLTLISVSHLLKDKKS